jgi:predicted transcriptional regulator
MNVSVKTTRKATNTKKKEVPMPVAAIPKRRTVRPGRERVLVEFSDNLLKRTDEAASRMEKNRSELIRTAVEQLLEGMERQKFEVELAAAYVANAQMNQELVEEFAHADSEGF